MSLGDVLPAIQQGAIDGAAAALKPSLVYISTIQLNTSQ